MKERDGNRRTIAYLWELLQKKLGGNIDVLLPGNLGVPISKPTLSTLAPSLLGVPSVAFPIVGGASGSQSSPFGTNKSLFPLSMPKNFSYPRVKDKPLVSPI